MTQTMPNLSSLKYLELALNDIAKMYDMERMDAERALSEAIESYLETDNFWFHGDGLWINGVHTHFRREQFKKVYQLFVKQVNKIHRESLLNTTKQILTLNKRIFYCELASYVKKDNVYILKPLIDKERYLAHVSVIVKCKKNNEGKYVHFPKNLKRIPVYLSNLRINKDALSDLSSILARGDMMHKSVAAIHLNILNKKFIAKYDVDLNLHPISVYSGGLKVQYGSDYELPLDVIKVIGHYFRSFNVNAYIVQ